MAEQTFRKMAKAKKDAWRCADCKTRKDLTFNIPPGDDTSTAILTEFKKLSQDLKKSMADLEKSVQFNSDQVEELLGKFDYMKSTFEAMQSKQAEIMKENAELKKSVKDLKNQISEIDQKALDHNIEISGVPDHVEEVRVLPLLCEGLGISVPDVTLYTVKRSKLSTAGRPKSIYIQFESKYTRDRILKESKKAKPKVSCFTRESKDTGSVYVNEQLSQHNKLLFYNANKIRKEKQYKYLWISEGNILLKKTEEATRTIRVRSLEDMQ